MTTSIRTIRSRSSTGASRSCQTAPRVTGPWFSTAPGTWSRRKLTRSTGTGVPPLCRLCPDGAAPNYGRNGRVARRAVAGSGAALSGSARRDHPSLRMKAQRTRYQGIAADVRLGADVRIHDFGNLSGCEVGDNTRIGAFVEIQKGAKIGRNCKISSHAFICEGVTIEDEVL